MIEKKAIPVSTQQPHEGPHLPTVRNADAHPDTYTNSRAAEHPADRAPEYTSGQAAELLGVSVRTLRHWDNLGVASPSGRTWAGYRMYSPRDMERLHRALVYRETGMPLADIREALEKEGSPKEHLERQQRAIALKLDRLHRMIDAVDSLIEREEMNEKLTVEKRAEILGKDWDPQFDIDAEEKYGHTNDWKEAQRRQRFMSTQDFEQATANLREVESRLVEALAAGVKPASEEAAALAEDHRASLVWFDVTHAKHALIAPGYTDDPRFAKHYNDLAPGLAEWLRSAVENNARRHGIDPGSAQWA